MGNHLISIVKDIVENKISIELLENICELTEKLNYSFNLDEMVQNIYEWFNQKYQVEDMIFSLTDMNKDITCIILRNGEKFYVDDEFTFYFIIDTRTELNAVISFKAKDKLHYNKIKKDYAHIETLFSQISSTLQSAILKKLHLESSSVDSVTHVYNRKYLLEYINKTISLSNEKKDDITFFMIGIDRFKAVIDEFDYDIGDKVLVELAKTIHSNIKEKDIVARLTGDEFLVALLHVSSENTIKNIAQRIIDGFAKVETIVSEETLQKLKKNYMYWYLNLS